jgi:hypothetical protein
MSGARIDSEEQAGRIAAGDGKLNTEIRAGERHASACR